MVKFFVTGTYWRDSLCLHLIACMRETKLKCINNTLCSKSCKLNDLHSFKLIICVDMLFNKYILTHNRKGKGFQLEGFCAKTNLRD